MANAIREAGMLASVLIMLISVSGCAVGPRGEEGNPYFLQGTQGLDVEILDSMPPSVIYSGDPLTLGIMLRNKGTSSITQGWLYIDGYDRSVIPPNGAGPGESFPGSDGYQFQILEHRTQYNDYGGEQFVQFSSGEIVLPEETPIYLFTLGIYALYKYDTIAPVTICLDPYPHRTNVDKPCIMRNVGMGTQGAPVAVTNAEVDNVNGEKARIVFTIKNVGNGDVIDLNAITKGPSDLTPSEINVVYANAYSSGGDGLSLTCMSQGEGGMIRLNQGGVGKLVCEVPIDGNVVSSYLKSFRVEVHYAYRQFLQKRIEVRGGEIS